MNLVPLTIEALGPLAFPERKPGVQFRTSLPYVPGAAIYGALGAVLGAQLDADAFATLFRRLRCHNAYPALAGDAWVRPLPMTAIEPKQTDAERKEAKRIAKSAGKPYRPYRDSLYARVCWEQQRPAALIYAPTDADGRPWEAVGRTFYTLEDASSNPWTSGTLNTSLGIGNRSVTQRVLTRVAINRRRGTAEDSRLYSPLVISEVMDKDKQLVQTRFQGSIIVPNGDTQIVAALNDVTHLGGRQTTGVGAVKIVQHSAAPEDDVAYLKTRVALMSRYFAEQAQLYNTLGGNAWRDRNGSRLETPGTTFTVNLLSDAILFEQGWLPTNELSGALLKELTGIDATLVRAFTTTSIVGGWHVLWQRPKPTAVATNMGSVFVFRTNGELSDADYDALAQLERAGIGERRAEGYGHVRICDEFHLLPPQEAL